MQGERGVRPHSTLFPYTGTAGRVRDYTYSQQTLPYHRISCSNCTGKDGE